MANPFDQFDQATPAGAGTATNPFDQFDSVDKTQQQVTQLGKNIGGGLEAAASLVAPFPSTIYGGLRGVYSLLSGQGSEEAARQVEEAQKSNFGAGAYQPFSEKGTQYADKTGEVLAMPGEYAGQVGEKYGGTAGGYAAKLAADVAMAFVDPMLPIGATIGLGKGAFKGGRALRELIKPGEVKGGPDVATKLDALDKAAEVPAAAAANPFDQFDASTLTKQTPMERMASDLGATEPLPAAPSPAMDSMVTGLTSESTPASRAAQQAIELRQKALEEPVAIQTSLEQNAAERARQENAPVYSAEHLAEQERLKGVSDEQLKQHQDEVQTLQTALDKVKEQSDTAEHQAAVEQAQKALDDRQTALEQETARRQSLDFNASERARQENAPTSTVETRLNDLRSAVEEHPAVAAAQARMDKQAAIIMKLQMAIEEGHPMGTQLIRATRDLKDFEATATAARNNVTEAYTKNGVPKGPLSSLNVGFRGQRGALDLGAIKEGARDLMDKAHEMMNASFKHTSKAEEYISQNIPEVGKALEGRIAVPDSPETTIKNILAPEVKDTPPIRGNTESGPGLASAKWKDNPLLVAVGRALNYAQKKADFQVRTLVQPLEKFFSTLSSKDLVGVHEVMKREMFLEKTYTPEQLQSVLSEKQYQAYQMLREAYTSALDIQNKALVSMGKKPITKGEAYMASTWHGDWHTPILDKNGRLAWYVRTTTKSEGVKAVAFLREKFKDTLDIPKDLSPEFRDQGRNPNTPNDVVGAYHDMMDFFKDNPEQSDAISSALKDYIESKGYTVAGQNKHFLQKNNVRGFEGDRPWMSERENAYAGTKAQMSYLKSATKWSHTQEAIANIKQIISNPDVVAKLPNAVEYAKTITNNEYGATPAVTAAIENAIAKMAGVSRSSLYRGTADVKTMAYLQILGLSPAYMLATPLQAIMTAPSWHRVLTNQGFTHNVFKTGLLATADTMSGIVSHMFHEMGGNSKAIPITEFGRKALQYAEDAGIVTKNMFDESVGLGQHALPAAIQSGMGWTIGFPEKVARMSAFMSFAHHLEASGKFTNKLEMFRKAEELTDNSMTSWKSFDRPQIVNKLGIAGQSAYMFKSFVFNGFNQLGAFSRMAHEYVSTGGKSGAISPLLTAVGMYGVMGGLASVPFANEIDGLWNVIKEGVAKFAPQHYSKVSGVGVKGTLISLMPETSGYRDLVGYGIPSAATGVQLASRMNLAAMDVEKPLGQIAPLAQEMKEWGSVGNVALHPTNKDAWLQSIHVNAPPLIKGQMETRLDAFKQGNVPGNQGVYKPDDLLNPQLQGHRRTLEDEHIRGLGAISLPEARDKEAQYINSRENARIKEAQQGLIEKLVSGVKRQDQDSIAGAAQAYLKLNPDEASFNKDLTMALDKMNFTPAERQAIAMKTVNQIQSVQRMRSMNR